MRRLVPATSIDSRLGGFAGCCTPRDPLTVRMTLLWHNHFATSNLKVANVAMMKCQNDKLRMHAMGKFGDLLRAVVKDAAMVAWLDAKSNRKEKPNENLARELMELDTLGVGHYSESDVKKVARALTGWTVRDDVFANVQAYHDDNSKTLLGREGNFDGAGSILSAQRLWLARRKILVVVANDDRASKILRHAGRWRASSTDASV